MVAPSIVKPVPTREKESTCVGLSLNVTPDPSKNDDDLRDSGSAGSASTALDTNSLASPQHGLETRVQELEEKLATLSLLLQQQRRSVPSISPPSITPPPSPPPDRSSYLALESPATSRPPSHRNMDRRKRNLSFRVLHCPDSPHQHGRISELSDSMFLPDGLPEEIHEELAFFTENNKSPRESRDIPSHELSLENPSSSSTPSKVHSVRIQSPTKDLHHDNATTTATVEKSDNVKSKWLDYLNSFQESHYDTDKQMEEFVKIPSAVEALLSFGFWICVDSFLYILTILPIRFIWSCLLLARFLAIRMIRKPVPDGPFRFHRRHSYQLIQVSIIYLIYKYVLLPISIGKFYHWIRGQAMVKLYVLIAMVEVFDRLMCSLGQDCLDSLYWNTTRRPRSSRLIVSVIVVLSYTAVHSFLLFVHVATLNVAMNSDDQALISLLIGGNFAEIKSTVFKKYNKANLFKIAASDICERFKLALFLALVLLLNISQGMDDKMIMNYIHMCGIVWCAEWLADWIKHSFITKFNYISSHIYPEYGLLLAGDVTGIGHEGVNLDHSHAVVKRIGFAQLPLVCVMARYMKEAFKYATYESQPSIWMVALGAFGIWSLLLLCKLSLGSFLQRISLAKLKAAPEFSSQNAKLEKKDN